MRLAASRPAALLREIGVPALFVVLWSTGFIGAKLGLPYAGPLTFLTLRYGLAAARHRQVNEPSVELLA